MRLVIFACAVGCATTACLDSRLVDCGDGRACPAGTVCATLSGNADLLCAPPRDVDACRGKQEFDPCELDVTPAACYATTNGLTLPDSGSDRDHR